MSKVRVYEYAKEHQVSSKKVIEALKDLGIEVANHMSTINENALRQLDNAVDGTNKKAEAPKKETTSNENGNSKGPNKPNMTNSNEKSNKPNKPAGQANKPATANKSQGAKPATNKPANTSNQTQSSGTQQQAGGQKRNNSNRPGGGNSNRPGGNNRPNRGGNFNNKGRNTKKKGKLNHSTVPPTPPKPKELPEKIVFSESLTVAELAKKLYREPSELIKKLFMLGVVATINQSLDKDAIELICDDYGVQVEEEIKVDVTDLDVYFENELNEAVDESKLVERPPVVTIMGHVDHGKTTLLDSLRNTKVTLGEAGGITQHIGAYQLEIHDKKITFLDTPGHAAFTAMRARGAQITDITILVVAADDGVMPQTIEAINHAKAAGMPIIVAVNKIDKPQANPDRVMQELTEYELVPEAWGGDTIFAPISAKFGEGLENLLDMILLVSEVEELKANPDRRAIGSVIEAELDKGRGPVATLLVQDGTLNIGDPIVVGNTFGRVRAMVNDLGRRVKKVGPSTPVEITGLNDVPQAGDRFVVFEDEKTARNIGETRASRALVAQRSATNRVSLDNLFEHMKAGEMKEVNVIIKADVQGSVEALAASLRKIDVEGVNVKIIHTAVGAINESDITLAAASNAIVIGFNVRPTAQAREAAENESVDIRLHRVIYKAIDEIEAAMKGMLDPEFQEKIIGQAQVRQTINVSKVGTIAGCYVTDGKITRDSGVRIIRDGIVVFEGEIATLKRFKDDAKEVAKGYECGITVQNFNDIKEDDVIEAYVMEEIERK
ncbi:translation initiation factor IF-2 [Listeria monocytogenes]|jgi:bacterial translation initiation factor 2 (bIF-2)|uniref:Translation initiation factor IF-2 n=3 Tax=Listeria monocytogenes TaxID=1639 RepID=IF2_LISMO|nr:translation initiation factor IF-2 [Listeria monocytogenes]NP_464850.1 translation initiation factor IF-2 [Listeria monocytogenes EGD-e]Q8Y7F6.1 RecName: Full=Translation initiation factor IF-2 [Listeria monocytogenes EGD-e]EAD5035959.1 translation initiation factor IF-2 [Listeria monocytogenes serotype 1/2a]EAE3701310.1 translation initiation factor IF-2 [Listeria monocytogenes serotype 1/2c]AEO25672.1 translation initiation factor IF-2 [Listeria monocytogenes FSL R2-561]ALU76382.1 transl